MSITLRLLFGFHPELIDPAKALSQSIITNINFVKFTLFYKVSQRLTKRRDTERHLCISLRILIEVKESIQAKVA